LISLDGELQENRSTKLYFHEMPIDPIGIAKSVMEAVKKYNDVPLMQQVIELQSAVLDLQREKFELLQALSAAKLKLSTRESVTKKGQYFYKAGDDDPLCPICWSKDEKMVFLPPAREWNGGIRRDCNACQSTLWDRPMSDS
jgi:hypothetical protein